MSFCSVSQYPFPSQPSWSSFQPTHLTKMFLAKSDSSSSSTVLLSLSWTSGTLDQLLLEMQAPLASTGSFYFFCWFYFLYLPHHCGCCLFVCCFFGSTPWSSAFISQYKAAHSFSCLQPAPLPKNIQNLTVAPTFPTWPLIPYPKLPTCPYSEISPSPHIQHVQNYPHLPYSPSRIPYFCHWHHQSHPSSPTISSITCLHIPSLRPICLPTSRFSLLSWVKSCLIPSTNRWCRTLPRPVHQQIQWILLLSPSVYLQHGR